MPTETPIYDRLHEEWLATHEGREPGVLSPEEIARYPMPDLDDYLARHEDALGDLLS